MKKMFWRRRQTIHQQWSDTHQLKNMLWPWPSSIRLQKHKHFTVRYVLNLLIKQTWNKSTKLPARPFFLAVGHPHWTRHPAETPWIGWWFRAPKVSASWHDSSVTIGEDPFKDRRAGLAPGEAFMSASGVFPEKNAGKQGNKGFSRWG